jgi:hypothetical protein
MSESKQADIRAMVRRSPTHFALLPVQGLVVSSSLGISLKHCEAADKGCEAL